MEQRDIRDDALFEAIKKRKRKKRRKIIRTVVFLVLLLALGLTIGVRYLQRQVKKNLVDDKSEISTAVVSVGSISTQVSGSGTLLNVDEESLTVPAGVTIDEVLVSANEPILEGQVLARVNTVSVLNAMDALQTEMSTLDNKIYEASADTVDNYITSGVEGRVKKIYAHTEDDVVRCMAENGALAVLSLDGYLVVRIPAPNLTAGTAVKVRLEDGTELDGIVEENSNGIAAVLVSDDGPEIDEMVTVLSEEGQMIGTGNLTIHSSMRISGISGTISVVYIEENQRVYSGSSLFGLADLSYYAKYQTLLDERSEMEETLLELMSLYQNGAVLAPYSGSVSSVDYDENSVTDGEETAMFTISPDRSMQVTMNVDESNILSLEVGQSAQITVSSIGDAVFPGTVTEINKTANSSSGVTLYAAVITLNKMPEMLPGMSAKVVVRIQGVDRALLIPIDALNQTSSSSYVYTSYDEETKEFGGLIPVTVGITNSNYAEITSGLQEGDTVCYTQKQSTTGFQTGFGGMPNMAGGIPGMNGANGNMGGGNYGSNGGNRPSGNGNGERPTGRDRN
ncbi:MAG: efflux RND transporter periplasmic adaptor subunit [Oscillospiraceae bacterium]|nr:efflux RND transporter periplasmic adaptor subunit [Oscillospiraceae bacterium]